MGMSSPPTRSLVHIEAVTHFIKQLLIQKQANIENYKYQKAYSKY